MVMVLTRHDYPSLVNLSGCKKYNYNVLKVVNVWNVWNVLNGLNDLNTVTSLNDQLRLSRADAGIQAWRLLLVPECQA